MSYTIPPLEKNINYERWDKQYIEPLTGKTAIIDSEKWPRLICEWPEIKSKTQVVTHTYAACVNLEKHALFMDCRPRKIFAKVCTYLFGIGVMTIAKTFYHASLIKIVREIFKTIDGKQTKTKFCSKTVKSLADIVRTPLYCVILTVVTVSSILLAVILPNTLYYSRDIIGKIEQSANWGKKRTPWTVGNCFQAYDLTELTERFGKKMYPNTVYLSDDPLTIGMTNFARYWILERRTHYNPFDQLRGGLDPRKQYISPILLE